MLYSSTHLSAGLPHLSTVVNQAYTPQKNATNKAIVGRRKAAKMLVAVVILFAICFAPVFAINIIQCVFFLHGNTSKNCAIQQQCRGFDWDEHISAFAIINNAWFTFAVRFLMYFNSCINPIIYNFMSGAYVLR